MVNTRSPGVIRFKHRSIPADDHSANDRRPATVEDLVCEVVVMGDEAPQRSETEEEDDEGRRQPLVTI